jgi:hypothetical protein
MKKSILIFLLCIIGSLSAQKTHMIGITIGTASPSGNFAKQGDSSTGFASSGLNYTLNYDYVTSKNWGGYFTFVNQSFGFDADNYTDLKDPDFRRTSYKGFRYNIKSLNYGLSYIINKNHKISFVPKLGIGLSLIRANEVSANYNVFGSNVSVTESTNSAVSINYNFGFDLTFRKSVESQFSYYLKSYWQAMSPEINHTNIAKFDGQILDKTISKYTQSMGHSSFSIGVRYILKSKS